MRLGLACAVLLTVSATSLAETNETVVVSSSDLDGIWKVNMPEYSDFALFHGVTWGPLGGHFCRLRAQKAGLTLDCLGFGPISPWSVTLDGTKLRMDRSSTISSRGFDGVMRSPLQFSGTFYAIYAGSRYDDEKQAEGNKLEIALTLPDHPGKAALLTKLLGQMASGAPLEPHDGHQGGLYLMTPRQLQPLGDIKAVTYLGEFAPINGWNADRSVLYDPKTSNVYDVEFERGELLCGIHQTRGVLVGFRCI